MKKLLSFCLLLISCTSFAQNYQCLQYGPVNYFINGNYYMRGIRVDSVATSGSSTVFYPYHSPRGAYGCDTTSTILDSNGGSWLGKVVIMQADGNFLFDNIWHDTTVIKTQAVVGDTWTFFNDGTSMSYQATLTAVDTMTVLGTLDSIKRIDIEADSNGVPNPNDPVNGFQIILSKDFGFVQIFDLYTFPYHRPNSTLYREFFDYYYDLSVGTVAMWDVDCFHYMPDPDTTNSIYHITAFHNPTQREISNYSVGDMYQQNSGSWYGPDATPNEITSSGGTDSIISKTITAYSTTYSVYYRSYSSQQVLVIPTGYQTTSSSVDSGYGSFTVDTTLTFDMHKLPEEWGAGYFFHYKPQPPDSCIPPFTYTYNYDNVSYTVCSIMWVNPNPDFSSAEILNNRKSCAEGVGEIDDYYTSTFNGNSLTGEILIKNGAYCNGYRPPNAVGNIKQVAQNITVFPNPAYNELNITSTDKIYKVSINNILGQEVYNNSFKSENVQMDISHLPAGMYVLRINDVNIRKFMKQ